MIRLAIVTGILALAATATLSRAAFGIAPKTPAALLADDVKITIEIDAVKQ